MTWGNNLKGTAVYEIEGADPDGCVNRIAEAGIQIWNVRKIDDFTYTFVGPAREETLILSMIRKCYCTGSCLEKRGFYWDLKKLCLRPFLPISVILAFLITCMMSSLIWIIAVQVEDPEIEREIRYALREMGVDIWSPSENVDPTELRYALLNRIPELSWVAVNPKGGKITVFANTMLSQMDQETNLPRNLVAVRDGVITDSVVLEGMALVKPGDSVKKGQILISGIEDYGIYMKAVCADGEIYGQTWRQGTVVTLSQRSLKQYTGRSWQEYFILFGRKSINLSGSSRNLGVTCDKIIDTKQISPPDSALPLYLQRVTYREYVLQDQPMPRDPALELLCRSWETCLLSSMVAGRIESTDFVCFENGGLYIFQGQSVCQELLTRPMPLDPPEKGADPIGTDH